MSSPAAIVKIDVHGALIARERDLVERGSVNARRPLSKATERAYASDWAAFEGWCRGYGLSSLPADEPTLCVYLTHLADSHAYASVNRAYSAIRVKNADVGKPLGQLLLVRNVLANLLREKGATQVQKRALEYHQVCAASDRLPATVRGRRDRAILLFGELFSGRRSEIASLHVRDLAFEAKGVAVTLRKSKRDQVGRGVVTFVNRRKEYCPVEALETWLRELVPCEGPVFRAVYARGPVAREMTGEVVSKVVKQAAESLGLDPREYGGHSIRRGFVTTAAKQGATAEEIMRVTHHKSYDMVKRYIDLADPSRFGIDIK